MTAPEPRAVAASLFAEYRESGDRRLRNELVEAHLHTVDYFVGRYSHRSVAPDDLRQVALLALVHAVDRFDPDRGVAFSTFASRTIEGEIKRHFRDRTWSIRPPRRSQELHLAIRGTDEELTQQLGRSPTLAELADALHATEDQIIEALEAGTAYRATSLDQPAGIDDPTAIGERLLGVGDHRFQEVEEQVVVRELLGELPEREREVIYLRFFENLSQPEIAERIGVSQSYLSRIIRRTLADLRERLEQRPANGD